MPADLLLRIENREDLGASHHLLTLRSEEPLQPWQAGQFAMITVGPRPDSIDPLLRRPFSIYNLPDDGAPDGSHALQVFFKVLGRGSEILSRSRAGDWVRCLAPLGKGFAPTRPPGSRLLLVAGGVGAASLHPLALREIRDGGKPLMLYGCRTSDDLAGVGPTRSTGVEISVATDDGSAGHRGFVSDLLDRFLGEEGPDGRKRWVICACGPMPMLKSTAEVAGRHGVPCYVSLESPMACGFGVCVGCVIGTRETPDSPLRYKRICMDGPVFDASTVCW